MIYTQEVENMCPVAQGVHHGAAPVPTEGKWVQNKKVEDISGVLLSRVHVSLLLMLRKVSFRKL